jgi:hypothetical protein
MEQAIKNTALINGIAYVPPGTTELPAGSPQPSLAERAKAALAAAAAAPRLPSSHSDLPAGAPAGQSEAETAGGMTTSQLEAKLEGMTPDQMAAFLARVA